MIFTYRKLFLSLPILLTLIHTQAAEKKFEHVDIKGVNSNKENFKELHIQVTTKQLAFTRTGKKTLKQLCQQLETLHFDFKEALVTKDEKKAFHYTIHLELPEGCNELEKASISENKPEITVHTLSYPLKDLGYPTPDKDEKNKVEEFIKTLGSNWRLTFQPLSFEHKRAGVNIWENKNIPLEQELSITNKENLYSTCIHVHGELKFEKVSLDEKPPKKGNFIKEFWEEKKPILLTISSLSGVLIIGWLWRSKYKKRRYLKKRTLKANKNFHSI